MLTLLFLGRLEDVAGSDALTLSIPADVPLGDVLLQLPRELAEAVSGPQIRLARNGVLVAADGLILRDGDELAFLPPVSGG